MFSCWGVPCPTWHPKDAGISPPMPSLAWFEAALSPSRMHCASWLPKVHRNGSVTYDHQTLGAVIVHPDMRAVLPCMPAPLVQHDGTGKNDGERQATTRVIATLRQNHPHLQGIVTADRLSAHAPHIATLQAHDLHAMRKSGGSVWESNPPSRVLAPITGFEVQAAHQHRYASRLYFSSL